MSLTSALPIEVADPQRPMPERVQALLNQMTRQEKMSQLLHESPAIERLGIPAYNWWNECSHGVARYGLATVFPHAIAHAATFDVDMVARIGEIVSDEARAKHHEAVQRREYAAYGGLTFWTPNINIARDPRWGRIQETYGECPYLTARIAVAYIRALQGNHPRYLKLAATAKHFAVHSGPEHLRHSFDSQTSLHDLYDTYLPAFEACVREANVESIMTAYTRLNGEACTASPFLLEQVLRQTWGFSGHVVSDCGAVEDLCSGHNVAGSMAQASAMALKAGCDLNCGCAYKSLHEAYEQGLITDEDIDRALRRVLLTRFKLGMFDPPQSVPYTQIPYSVVDCAAHDAYATQVAAASMVLLKNNGVLPFASDVRRVAVVGPNADDAVVMFGNYYGQPSHSVTALQGLRAALPNAEIRYAIGCPLVANDDSRFQEAVDAAREADVVVFVGGLSQVLEGEDMQDEGMPPGMVSAGDRTSLELPQIQQRLLRTLHAVGVPIVLVIYSGSAVTVNWEDAHLAAIVQAWYPGQNGGVALAQILLGHMNPAARMPLTVYRSLEDVPPIESYAMHGRTYRYMTAKPLYAFGHGLSYTTFTYDALRLSHTRMTALDTLTLEVTLTNSGTRVGDEVVQVYVQRADSPDGKHTELVAFTRVHDLRPSESRRVRFELPARAFSHVDANGQRIIERATFTVSVGGCQPDYAPHPQAVVTGALTVEGR